MPDWIQITLRTLVAVVILFFMTKVLGKRQISELSLFEYITGITIGNIAAYISLDLDNLWFLGVVSIGVWVGVSVIIEYITLKSRRLRNFIDGKGRVLIKDGQLQKKALGKERLTTDELLEQLRGKNVFRVADVEFAIMEPSGEINVLLKKKFQPITADDLGWTISENKMPNSVIMDGEVIQKELDAAGQNLAWLERELARNKLEAKDVFLAQIDDAGQLSVQTTDGRHFPEQSSTKSRERVQILQEQYEAELMRLKRLARNEGDRRVYQSALDRLK